MASYRHLSRMCVLQSIFAVEFHEGGQDEILHAILKEFAPKMSETDFAHELMNGIIQNKTKILKTIGKHAPQWPVDKIAKVDRAILEIGTFEIMFSKDVPAVVAINEAIELAKHFGDENSPRFINGVLSGIMHAHAPKKAIKPTQTTRKNSTKSKSKSILVKKSETKRK